MLDFEAIDKDILFCYLNIAMTSTANIRFKEKMICDKLSDTVTVFEEAFGILVLENNFDRWVYMVEEEMKQNSCESTVTEEDEDTIISNDNNFGNIPDVLYQKNVKVRKDNRQTAGRWTDEGMERLNELLMLIKDSRNDERRQLVEDDLMERYVNHADNNMEAYNRRKRRLELEDENSKKKKVVVHNMLDIVSL